MTLTPQNFLRRWTIERNIFDALTGQQVVFTGVADISDGADHWLYRESGQLKMGTAPSMTAERCYLWRAGEDGVDVYFEDGRFFHRMALAGAAKAAHWCDPDQYDVSYEFTDWPVWRATWAVSGPRKNYTMRSIYKPF